MLKKIYDNSPALLQDVFLTLQAFRYRRFRQGGRYKDFLNFLQRSQFFSKEEMLDWQLSQFKRLFGGAYENTLYYQTIFDSIGVDPRSIKSLDFLQDLPILTKDMLRESPENYIDKSRKVVYTARTGGTTGAPLITPFDGESTQLASAFLTRFFEQVGVKYGERNLHMTGQQIVPANEKKKFWRTDLIGHSLYLSVHHLGPSTFPLYWNKIIQFKPKYIFGYTSFIYELARYINEHGKSRRLVLDGVFPSSEKLTPEMREAMESAFACKVYDHYGSTEGIPLITQCRLGSYHIVPESGIIEFCDEKGEVVETGRPAEMYMTSLRQFSRPILRYRIGDTAILSNQKCECGLWWPVVQELTGRVSEWIILRDGRRISQFSHQVFKKISNVLETQIIQHEYENFEVIIVKSNKFTERDEKLIRKRFEELLGFNADILFNYVASIPRTSGGKKPSLISKVSK